MKTRFFFLLFLFSPLYALTISEIALKGNSETAQETILFFFCEYNPSHDYSEPELSQALSNWVRRLERTGWFRNISITTEQTDTNSVKISLELTERFFYTVQLYDHAVGFGKQNLWGKGKEVFFEVGAIQKRIILTDHMYHFSPFFYQIALGTTEGEMTEYRNNFYQSLATLNQEGSIIGGYRIFPDHSIKFLLSGQIVKQTNQLPLEQVVQASLSYQIDNRKGYPSFRSGWYLENDLHSYAFLWSLSWETTFTTYHSLSPRWVVGIKWHHGVSTGELPASRKYLLRQINGLHTLSQSPGLIGNNCWDAHLELRWQFWDVIPFVIFDMQLEAVGFVEAGEAWQTWQEWGSHPYGIYGGGIRIYVDRFAIRTEVGIDQNQQPSVISSFQLPF